MSATDMEITRKYRTEGNRGRYRRLRVVSFLLAVLGALLLCVLLFGVWLRPVRITGDSMSPTLAENEIVLVDRLAIYWKMPERGDIVRFSTEDGAFIKRVIGLPGETVEVVDGHVFINSCPLDEHLYAVGFIGDAKPVTVPEGSFYLLGDNREKMYDSRLSSVGCIPVTELEGAVRLRISPLSRILLFF